MYRRSVRSYRFVFTPKWLGFHALTWLVLIPAFIGLGQWQRDLWRGPGRAQGGALSAPTAPPGAPGSAAPRRGGVRPDRQRAIGEATPAYHPAPPVLRR